MSRALTRRERVRRRPEFLRVQRQGIRTRARYMTLFVLRNELDVTRLGIIATRRIGGATRRNRSKRLVRELFCLNKNQSSLDIVVMPHPGFSDVPFASLEADYRRALKQHMVAALKERVKSLRNETITTGL